MKRILIFSISILFVAGFVVWKFLFRDAALSVASEKPEFEMSAAELYRQFAEDEENANRIYLNKIIRLTGKVGETEITDEGLNVFLTTPDSSSGVICNFTGEVKNSQEFKPGVETTIQGICSGYLFDVVLVKCALYK